jgi:hypothetical protein
MKDLVRKLEISSLLDCKLYLRIFSSTFGELLEMITPIIQKQDMLMTD